MRTNASVSSSRSLAAPWLWPMAVVSMALLCSSCIRLHTKNVDGSFEGLIAALERTAASNATLRLLVVHGMGHHPIGWSSNLIGGVTRALRLPHRAGGDPRIRSSPTAISTAMSACRITSTRRGARPIRGGCASMN